MASSHPLAGPFVRDQLLQRTVDLNGKRHNPEGAYVLYWMQATHRLTDNWALRAAIRAANKFNRPLLIHQGLDPTYPFAADRHHAFVLQGVRDTLAAAKQRGLYYQFVLRRRRDDDRRVVDRLASQAYLVVTDLFPTAGIRERSTRFAERVGCRVLAVDSSCIVPSGIFPTAEYAARTIRPKLGRLIDHAMESVHDELPRVALSAELRARVGDLTGCDTLNATNLTDAEISRRLAECDIDHSVRTVPQISGGSVTAQAALAAFISQRLPHYSESRNDAGIADGTSALSPYLHFGQLASVEAVRAARESGAPAESIEAFVQQITTWRELSFNWCVRTPGFDQLASLPAWVQKTMDAHVHDARPVLYDLDTLERGETHDAFWNAAQNQLRETGVIHNYARMLWGKTLLLWTPDYETARTWMFYLNDKWALDGRDPNSVGGIMWCLGLWDRPWGNKPVWGGIRPMVTSRVRLKFDTAPYLARWGGASVVK